MANLVKNKSGIFSIRFRFGPHRFNRSLETANEGQKDKGLRGKRIRADTIKKELQTIRNETR